MNPVETLVYTKQEELLSHKICELPLNTKASHLEELILRLYKELDKAGIIFKPKTYLSDGWGCPNEVPVIGIPFYLADTIRYYLQTRLHGIRVEDDMYIMKLLRHEAGHTFNYAYRLFDKPEWQTLFGRFSLPYTDEYTVHPNSTRFVNHLSGCYAQRHPDDDFAETFAVWLTPNSNWKKDYAGTKALEKLKYVNKVVSRYGKKPPIVIDGRLDMPVEDMAMTLGEWYEKVYKHRDERAAHPKFYTRKYGKPYR
jgi:hypothetical protein